MGTTWHVTYLPPPQIAPSSEIQKEIDNILGEINLSMSTYLDSSEITRFNLNRPNQWFDVSEGFFEVIQTALTIGEASDGAYDVTVAPLVNLWGFGPDTGNESLPEQSELTSLLQNTGQDKLRLHEKRLQLRKSAKLSLDFSSIAKGYGVDRVADWLGSLGVVDFLVEVGGEMRLQGNSPRASPWRIAIEQPDNTIGSIAAALSLSDKAVATSGDYRNYFEVAGKRYSHTIDPRTGYPVEHDLVSVTVVHSRAMIADGWATAIMVMGAERGMTVALEKGLAVYFIRRRQGEYSASYSPEFENYLESSK